MGAAGPRGPVTGAAAAAHSTRCDGYVRPGDGPDDPGQAWLPVGHGPDNHAANLLELAGGDLLCAWFAGSGEGNPDTDVMLARLPAGSGRWSDPVDLSLDPRRSEQNPVLFQAPGGEVWLLHTSGEPHDQKTAHVLARVSRDDGHTWDAPRVLFPGTGVFLRHPPLILPTGAWVLPTYLCTSTGHFSVVQVSEDRGRSWRAHPVPESVGRVQMNLLAQPDGTLLGLFRSRAADRIYTSRSTDGGRTWRPPLRSTLPNNDSSFQAVTLAGGRIALAFNDATLERDQFRWVARPGGGDRKKALRTPLTLALSEDGGETWPHRRNLQMADLEYRETEAGYAYPSVVPAREGGLHVAFSYLRKAIKYLRVTEEWVRRGEGAG